MTRDPVVLENIIKYALFVAAFFATLFPLLYSFSEWNKSVLGRILMLHGISLALALDVTVLFYFWQPKDILVFFWVEIVIFSLIAVANLLMCVYLVRYNYMNRSEFNESA